MESLTSIIHSLPKTLLQIVLYAWCLRKMDSTENEVILMLPESSSSPPFSNAYVNIISNKAT